MKTPDEIKKGLECCADFDFFVCEDDCNYVKAYPYPRCRAILAKDALACIQHLERERDTAVEDMRSILGTGLCHVCKKKHTVIDETGSYICEVFDRNLNPDPTFCGQFEWRGVQEVE